jgi:hypothetical protein
MNWTYLLWYLPLLAAVSLVYGGTRHEQMPLILHQAWHTAVWVTTFMAVIFLGLAIVVWLV